ncbi:unnamed protein product, partial [Closterium sp. Naga37s-1]
AFFPHLAAFFPHPAAFFPHPAAFFPTQLRSSPTQLRSSPPSCVLPPPNCGGLMWFEVFYAPVDDMVLYVAVLQKEVASCGLMWFEMFYAPVDDMVLYVAVLQQLRYRRLHWTLMPKPDRGEIEAHQLYLNCVIEKPARRNALKPVEFV